MSPDEGPVLETGRMDRDQLGGEQLLHWNLSQAMNYSCSGAEWNKGSEDNIGRVFGCLAVKISFLLLSLNVVFLLLFFYAD